MLKTNGRAQSAIPANVACWISTGKEGSPNGTGSQGRGEGQRLETQQLGGQLRSGTLTSNKVLRTAGNYCPTNGTDSRGHRDGRCPLLGREWLHQEQIWSTGGALMAVTAALERPGADGSCGQGDRYHDVGGLLDTQIVVFERRPRRAGASQFHGRSEPAEIYELSDPPALGGRLPARVAKTARCGAGLGVRGKDD